MKIQETSNEKYLDLPGKTSSRPQAWNEFHGIPYHVLAQQGGAEPRNSRAWQQMKLGLLVLPWIACGVVLDVPSRSHKKTLPKGLLRHMVWIEM